MKKTESILKNIYIGGDCFMQNYRIMKNGIKQESTSYRPQEYSRWHRSQLPHWCMAYDVDMIEYRMNRGIVGIFEVKRFQDKKELERNKNFVIMESKRQIQVYRLLTNNQIFDSYFVLHTKDMQYFEVWNLSKDQYAKFKIFNGEEYARWIENL